ncbi:MAG: 3-dehydroquinate [Geobacteraceae bacterium]|nr:MAG: 3-dehydroquinate [Geobacteraceae bacterium]
MDNITVGLGERSYKIFFGHQVLAETGPLCRDLKMGSRAAVVTNPTVGAHYFEPVRASLAKAGFTVHRIEIPDGEEYKNSETLKGIYDRLIDLGLDRGSYLVALGGGVVGDIAGYAAATYLRGIPFVQVPTTLLAQVDSSVGGKTGINHEKGKNLIGAFYQPGLVMIDVATLDTLPEREYLSGLAEVAKYGIVLDGELFDFIFNNTDKLLGRDTESLLFVIQRSCAIKASVVEKDERETGLRAVLNYGHTVGHAVETLTGYTKYKHGEAVAIGMVAAAKYAESMGLANKSETERIITLLKALRLPVELPEFSVAAYTEALLRDKKVRDGGLNFVFNKGIGGFHFARVTDLSPLLKTGGIGG